MAIADRDQGKRWYMWREGSDLRLRSSSHVRWTEDFHDILALTSQL